MSARSTSKVDVKVVMLGDKNVGKTTLLQRYISDQFVETQTTIGASFFLKNWRNFNIAIWDTAGEEKFRSISALYCRGAGASVLAYDMTDKSTFKIMDEHVELLKKGASPECVIIVVGTKLDLVMDNIKPREVTSEEAQKYASSIGAAAFFETSSKTAYNVAEVFDKIGSIVFKDRLAQMAATQSSSSSSSQLGGAHRQSIAPNNTPSSPTIQLDKPTTPPSDKKCCS